MRLITLVPMTLFLLLAGVLIFTLQGQIDGTIKREQIPSALIEKLAPQQLLPNYFAEEKPLSLQSYTGEVILVNFFASWCVPCRAEMPMLAEIADDITLIGIAYKDHKDDTEKFLEDFGNPYTAIGVDVDGRYAIEWGLYGIPETYIISPEGNILFRHAGALDRAMIENTLRPIWEAAQ